jgi:hypothetical protein
MIVWNLWVEVTLKKDCFRIGAEAAGRRWTTTDRFEEKIGKIVPIQKMRGWKVPFEAPAAETADGVGLGEPMGSAPIISAGPKSGGVCGSLIRRRVLKADGNLDAFSDAFRTDVLAT